MTTKETHQPFPEEIQNRQELIMNTLDFQITADNSLNTEQKKKLIAQYEKYINDLIICCLKAAPK